ncbi:MAG: N-formylglutamate deformylase [Pirellulaceae bacterium]|jgi:N-formylglutamate deformylase
MAEQIWKLTKGTGPIIATAIHDGHEVRDELIPRMSLNSAERLREEDPHTGEWTAVAPTRIVGTRSRFEVDLNRPREKAVYRKPEDAWGLHVWKDELPDESAARSLAEYDAFYQMLDGLYTEMEQEHGAFVVFDLHTYNHRRDGTDRPAADEAGNPQVNIGTGTQLHRERFGPVVTQFMNDLRSFDFPGGKLDVRENVKFQGGNHAKWAHMRFPESACVIAIEFKKFFMDEWTGTPKFELVSAIGEALKSTTEGVLEALRTTTVGVLEAPK